MTRSQLKTGKGSQANATAAVLGNGTPRKLRPVATAGSNNTAKSSTDKGNPKGRSNAKKKLAEAREKAEEIAKAEQRKKEEEEQRKRKEEEAKAAQEAAREAAAKQAWAASRAKLQEEAAKAAAEDAAGSGMEVDSPVISIDSDDEEDDTGLDRLTKEPSGRS